MARAQLYEVIQNTAGDIQGSITVNLYKPGTTTPIAAGDTQYLALTGATTVGDDVNKTLTTNANGIIEAYFENGTDVPGFVRVYSSSPAIDKQVWVGPHPQTIQVVSEPNYTVHYDGTNYVAQYSAAGTRFTHATDAGSVIQSALNALQNAAGLYQGTVEVKPRYDAFGAFTVNSAITVNSGAVLRGSGGVSETVGDTIGVKLKAGASFPAGTSVVSVAAKSKLEGLQVDANSVATSTAVTCTGAAWKIYDCGFYNGGGTQTLRVTSAAPRGILRNSWVQGGGTYTYRHDSSDCIIMGNHIRQPVAGGTPLYVTTGLNQFIGNHINGNSSEQVVLIDTGTLLFNGNYFDAANASGTAALVKIVPTAVINSNTFNGNLFWQPNAADGTTSGIVIDTTTAAATNQQIVGNFFHGKGAGTGKFQYILEYIAPSAAKISGNMFALNTCIEVTAANGLWSTRPPIVYGNVMNTASGDADLFTENDGTDAFAAATTKVVTHELVGTPRSVLVTPTDNRTLWVTAIGATTFTVNAAAGNSSSFAWKAYM